MARLNAIPKALLPDSVEVFAPAESDYMGTFEESGRMISHVRYVCSNEVAGDGYVFEDGSTGVLFVDAVNSTGAFAIAVGSKVVVNGSETKVAVKCQSFRGLFGGVHHWEVELA